MGADTPAAAAACAVGRADKASAGNAAGDYEGNEKKYIAKQRDWLGRPQAQFPGYHPCEETHEAKENTGFIDGYIDDQSTWDDEKIPVVIWTNNGTNVHCTTNLDISTWATAKS